MRHRSVAVLSMVILVAAMVAPALAAPRIMVTPEVHDFGNVEAGDEVATVFTVVNAGDADLEIKEVITGCDCTVARISSSVIAPGGRAEIGVTYNSTGANGQVTRSITVLSSDPDDSRKILGLAATVVPKPGGELVVTPHSLSTGKMAPGASVLYAYELRNSGDGDLEILQVAATEGVSVELAMPYVIAPKTTRLLRFILKPGQKIPMNVTIAPTITDGRFQEMITIWSTSAQRPQQRMVIRGQVAAKK